MDNIPELAARLRLAREQAGLSQGQIAKLLNYHRPTISEIEAGRRKVSAEELALFSQKYGVSTSWLLGESEEGLSPAIELAARELSSLSTGDLDKVLRLLESLRKNSP